MKRPQWITLTIAVALVALLYKFGRIIPEKKAGPVTKSDTEEFLATDTIINQAKKRLTSDQVVRLDALEHSVVRGDVKTQKLTVYHRLAHFWADTGQIFEPYAWYEAEAARLENSEKSLTFAAHLFLENLRGDSDPALRTWKAMQAKDLFERSLNINPNNDSSTVGLGACYIFGGISSTPMEGIMKVRAIVEKDSTNVFAQEVLGHGSMISGQYDKATTRFETVYRLSQQDVQTRLEACLMLGEAYERLNNPASAAKWYERSLPLIKNENIIAEVKKRIEELSPVEKK